MNYDDRLGEIFELYGRPDPKTISQIEKNGVKLNYVGHGEITRILGAIDPAWTWEPLAIIDGRPAIHVHNGFIPRRDKDSIPVAMATMWGRLTLCGVTRIAVGSVEAHKPDLDKELVSDFLRNGAMRFGIALGLWIKDDPVVVVPFTSPRDTPRSPSEPRRAPEGVSGAKPATEGQRTLLTTMAAERGYTLPALETLTFGDASDLITHLKTVPKAKKPTKPDYPDEEPF